MTDVPLKQQPLQAQGVIVQLSELCFEQVHYQGSQQLQ